MSEEDDDVQPTEISTICPSCAAYISVSARSLAAELPQPWWQASVTIAEVVCPLCGWEFAVDEEGRVTDDGGLDPEGPFEVGPEGELVTETLLPATCPTCGRRFEVGEPGATPCPGCRHVFGVDDPIPPALPETASLQEYDEDELPYDESLCPACGSDGDLDSAGFVALDHGWVVCQDCGWEFYCDDLFQDFLAWQREERNLREETGLRQVVVAADGSGDCNDLTRAIDRVTDGGVIVIRPGVYSGATQFNHRRLTLRGEGPAKEIRVMGGLEATGSGLRLRGLTFTGTVQAHHSRLRLENCTIREAAQSGLEATGAGTAIRLRACRIEQCRKFAVTATRGTVVCLSNCSLSENADGGIHVEDGAWARLRECQVTGNRGDAIRAGPHASVFVHRSVVADNDGVGLVLHGSRAVVTGCRILNQTGTGVVLGPHGRLLMRRCEIRHGKAEGLEFGRRTRALICDCEVTANARTGLSVEDRTRVVLARCSITDNATGIRLAASARLRLRSCACRENRGGDWDIEPGGSLCVVP